MELVPYMAKKKVYGPNEHKWSISIIPSNFGPAFMDQGPCKICNITFEEYLNSGYTKKCRK